ncbi:MAG: SET domain-containing protein [Parcubacteria group bacterium]|nr:SET domain-containing protein [Parcubacteria group bacterium]
MSKKKIMKEGLVVKRAQAGAGFGLYTTDAIKKRDFVIEYKGEIVPTATANERGTKYLFDISTRRVIDGSPRYNTARYINHSCRENCESEIDGSHVYIYAIKNIKEGEELTYDYGKEYFDEYIKGHCKCGHCDGSGKVKKNSKKKTKKK